MKKDIYYKSRQSYENQKGFFRSNFTQVRKDKTSKYHKVDTRDFNSLIEFLKYYENEEYATAGKNSHEREVVIVDCDDEDFGAKTFELLKQAHLIPHAIKRKSNGHSQFFFFIEKFYISKGEFICGNYHETDFYENHQNWKYLTRMMNILFNGDVGYTGYNCQNPFFKDGDVLWVKPLDELYSIEFLIRRINHYLQNPQTLDYINKTIRDFYSDRKTNAKAVKTELRKIHFLDEEEAERLALKSKEELKNKLAEIYANRTFHSKEEIEEAVNLIINISEDSINKRIFELCCQICKSFWKKNLLHNKDYFDEIVYTCVKNWHYQDNAVGYTYYELLQRIKNNVHEIKTKDMHNQMSWEKVGYTKIQRENSLIIRKKRMLIKRRKVMRIFKDNRKKYSKKNLSFNAIAKDVAEQYNLRFGSSISISSIRLYIIKIYNDYLLKSYNKDKFNIYRFISHSHNNKLKSKNNGTIKSYSIHALKILYKVDRIKNVNIR